MTQHAISSFICFRKQLRQMRNFFIKAHLWLSIPFGIIIAIICLTGAVLVFEEELMELYYPERYFVEEVKDEKLTLSQLTIKAQENLPDSVKVTGFRIFESPKRTYKLYVDKGKNLLINPYTGDITGTDGRSEFFYKTIRLHRFLLHSYKRGEDTPWGKMIVGYSTIGFAFIILSGLFIWFPKNRKSLKRHLKIKTNAGSFRFWYDLHVAGGFYASIFLLAMVLTGLTWSFSWYRSSFYSMLGGAYNKNSQSSHHYRNNNHSDEAIDYAQWDKVLSNMKERYTSYNTITIQNQNASVSLNKYGNIMASDKFLFDGENGNITKEILYKNESEYSKLRGWVWAVHSGKWGGIITRILTCITCLLGVSFAITGYYFWIKKKMAKKK